jgi:hypothetical protein
MRPVAHFAAKKRKYKLFKRTSHHSTRPWPPRLAKRGSELSGENCALPFIYMIRKTRRRLKDIAHIALNVINNVNICSNLYEMALYRSIPEMKPSEEKITKYTNPHKP